MSMDDAAGGVVAAAVAPGEAGAFIALLVPRPPGYSRPMTVAPLAIDDSPVLPGTVTKYDNRSE